MSFGFKTYAKRTTVDGISFPSQLEASLYAELRLEEKAGLIRDLEMQVRVDPRCCPACGVGAPSVKVDFRVFDLKRSGDVYHEAKGLRTDRWIAFEKWWRVSGPAPLRVYTTGTKGRVRLVEEIDPG